MNYKMILAYDGARYDGWQKQGNTQRTIQGKLEAVLSRLAGCPVEVNGAGKKKAARYGAVFLEAIRAYEEEKGEETE